jgi:hypothetical protein
MNAPRRQSAPIAAPIAFPVTMRRAARWSRRRSALFVFGTALAFWGMMGLVVHFAL